MLNQITIQGRLTRDPELRHTQSGTPVCSFSLAVERDIAAQDGTRKTDFIECVAWRGAGEHIAKYFRKGSMTIIKGRLELRDWTDKDGNKRKAAEINVENVYFCESKKTTDAGTSAGAGFDVSPDDDGELPF